MDPWKRAWLQDRVIPPPLRQGWSLGCALVWSRCLKWVLMRRSFLPLPRLWAWPWNQCASQLNPTRSAGPLLLANRFRMGGKVFKCGEREEAVDLCGIKSSRLAGCTKKIQSGLGRACCYSPEQADTLNKGTILSPSLHSAWYGFDSWLAEEPRLGICRAINAQGSSFLPGMPTEEVFSPDFRRAEGYVTSTKTAWLQWEHHRRHQSDLWKWRTWISRLKRRSSYERLGLQNKGARALGECALVPDQAQFPIRHYLL